MRESRKSVAYAFLLADALSCSIVLIRANLPLRSAKRRALLFESNFDFFKLYSNCCR